MSTNTEHPADLRQAVVRAEAEQMVSQHADAIQRMPYVRACLLEYASRPEDGTAAAAVKAIAAQVLSLLQSTPPAQEQAGQMVSDDLLARCREVLDWKNTGLLVDGALREYAKTMPHSSEHQQLRAAEDCTAEAAMRVLLSASPVQQDGAAPKGEAFPGATVQPEQYALNLLESCANWLETRAQVPQMVAGETRLMGIYAADLRGIKAHIAATPARADVPIVERQHPAAAMPSDEHQQLMKFYGVTTLEALVDAQADHVEKLQAKLPAAPSLAPLQVRKA